LSTSKPREEYTRRVGFTSLASDKDYLFQPQVTSFFSINFFVARFIGEERIGGWDGPARLPRSQIWNEEPRKALKSKHLYENKRYIEMSEKNGRRRGLPRHRLALLERGKRGARPNGPGQPLAGLDGGG
jgi:hypothetical protein